MEGLWVGGGGAWSCHGLRRSKTSGRKGELVEQAGRRRRKVRRCVKAVGQDAFGRKTCYQCKNSAEGGERQTVASPGL